MNRALIPHSKHKNKILNPHVKQKKNSCNTHARHNIIQSIIGVMIAYMAQLKIKIQQLKGKNKRDKQPTIHI